MPNNAFHTSAVLCTALLIVSGCQTTQVKKEPLTGNDSGRLAFSTTAMHQGKPITGVGSLELPDGSSGKIPLVILAHGTKGVGYRENSWSDYLNQQGYATFKLDYFSPRGTDGSGRYVPRPPEDVWGALKYLSTHPRLDMTKVAVMGFSNGGSVTRSSAEFTSSDTNGVMPKAFIMFYGGCHTAISNRIKDYDPALLYVVGDQDKLVKASTCKYRANDRGSSDIEVMVIPGAYHLFDGNQSVTFNHRKWGTVTVRANSSATDQARRKVQSLLARVFS